MINEFFFALMSLSYYNHPLLQTKELKRVSPDCPILFCDEHLLIVGKPAGLLTIPGKGADKQDSLLTRLQATYTDARIIHRLDQDTSGLLVFARHLAIQQHLNKQFADRLVNKHYIALAYGHFAETRGEIDLPLRYDPEHPPLHIVDYDNGQQALTRWQVLARTVPCTINSECSTICWMESGLNCVAGAWHANRNRLKKRQIFRTFMVWLT